MPERPTIAWRRLDIDGREAASLKEVVGGWQITGLAELRESNTVPSCLSYSIDCNQRWETRACELTGFVRQRPMAMSIRRTALGNWIVDEKEVAAVIGCVDIDLAFSPVTNLLPIRRLRLRDGATARVRAAWLRFPELTLEVLDQTYTRIDRNCYLYESADGAFRRELTVDDAGMVVEYPGLWKAADG
jgi:hypothetical protein